MRLRFVIALLCALAPLHAGDFSPAEFFGPGHFQPERDRPLSGSMKLPLTGPLPAFVDLNSSGDGDCGDRFVPAAQGLAIRPDTRLHRTCEAAIDLGADKLEAQFTLVELEPEATAAWHLVALDREAALDYLCELRRGKAGGGLIQIRVGDGAAFRQIPGASASLEALELPCVLRVELSPAGLSFQAAGKTLTVQPRATGGLRPGIAVSDGPARVRDLELRADLAGLWIADASDRLAARKALLQLRELALGGLLGGIWGHRYPAPEAEQAEFDRELAAAPADTLTAPYARRAAAMAAIARALPKNALALHLAGVAALLAGDVDTGLEWLQQAHRIRATSLTNLALAEGLRRDGRVSAAEAAMKAARKDMPAALEPDYQLLLGRLAASRGDLPGARSVLEVAARSHPAHAALRDFALSARSLTQPEQLRLSPRPGPLGLRLLSDLPEAQLATLAARLEPYLDRFRVWLPKLPRTLEGTVMIYATPVDYLNAALLVAGDNLDNVAGMYLAAGIDAKPTVLACRGFGEDELLRTLVHELWHLAFAATGLATDAPRWLNEGMAVYLSAGRVSSRVLSFDRIPAELDPNWLQVSAEDLQRALAADGIEFYVPASIRANYTAAWALVWHLAASEEGTSTLRKLLAGDGAVRAQVQKGLDDLAPRLAERLARLQKGG